jgi:hypothetical protein
VRVHTRICDLFGVEHPILNAPMGGGDAPVRSLQPSRKVEASA